MYLTNLPYQTSLNQEKMLEHTIGLDNDTPVESKV